MDQIPPLSDYLLTSSMDSSQSTSSISPTQPNGDSHQLLPGLRDIVGPEINSRRSLLPQPPRRLSSIPEFFIPGISVVYFDDKPIVTYTIGGAKYNMAQPGNETRSEHSRMTIDGRRITYRLEVVQQPEKARACGSGPRSSADRRPVDPPPVVELRVFCNDTDITMGYDATFMLYASLEVARPIASGKMHTPPAIPVLTGVAVASAAYLDRPKKAAYFIFPDLSVRHEGWYRLKFSLFEGVKHEADADQGMPFVQSAQASEKLSPPVRHESMSNRLEVQSIPFQVLTMKSTRQYNLPEPAATKRPISPPGYRSDAPMKAGTRPDKSAFKYLGPPPPPSPSTSAAAAAAHGPIKQATNEAKVQGVWDPLVSGPDLIFNRSDGATVHVGTPFAPWDCHGR